MSDMSYNLLITGGTGSLGTALCHRLKDDPTYSRVAILTRDWHKQDDLRRALGNPPKFRWFIGDVRDRDRLKRAFNGIDRIIHAAAAKDVVSSQYSPFETVLTNVSGTQNVIDAAIDCGVGRVLFVSSDKATHSVNVYGQTKALAEGLIVAANAYSPHGTKFTCVRYGNVVNSAGSVIPLFLKQCHSGTLTLTHEKMTRFWITLEQAVEFVLASLDIMRGGEIFVPHLPTASIMDLVTAIAPHARVEITGIRPGEKVHEILIAPEEQSRTRDLGWAYRVEPAFKFWDTAHAYTPGGSMLPSEFQYTSASGQRLSPDELKEMIGSGTQG